MDHLKRNVFILFLVMHLNTKLRKILAYEKCSSYIILVGTIEVYLEMNEYLKWQNIKCSSIFSSGLLQFGK